MSIWDDPEMRSGGDFIKFDRPGDSISGTITAVASHTFDDGKKVPQIFITTDAGDEKTLTAGQIRLKNALVEARPEVGDHLSVVFTQQEKRAGGKTLKYFDVRVRRGGQLVYPADEATTQQPAPVQQTAAAPVSPAPAAAPAAGGAPAGMDPTVWASLGPEQRAAIAALQGNTAP